MLKNELIKILEEKTKRKVKNHNIEVGYFDYPFKKKIEKITIGKIIIDVKEENILIKTNDEDPLLIYEVLQAYNFIIKTQNIEINLTDTLINLVNNPEIKIKAKDINTIPLFKIDKINITKIYYHV